jgi:hypothetical protein
MALTESDEAEVVVDYGYDSDDDNDNEEEDEDLFYLRDISSQHGSSTTTTSAVHRRDYEREMRAADRLSIRLLAVEDDEEEENRLLRKSLRLATSFAKESGTATTDVDDDDEGNPMLEMKSLDDSDRARHKKGLKARRQVWTMIIGAVAGLLFVTTCIILVGHVTGPPYQPVGPYALIESQSGEEFFQYYNFYEGADSVGSNGYNQYVNHEHAINRGIINVTQEADKVYNDETRSFIYMGTAPTNAGPRDSIRLEGTRRFNRGLFM